MATKARTNKNSTTRGGKSPWLSTWPNTLAMFPKVNSRAPRDSVTKQPSAAGSKTDYPLSASRSLMMSSSLQSKLLMQGQLIWTIKYICPHCSAVHFLDFPLYTSMNGKTFRRLTLHCLRNSQKVGSLRWETDGRQFMLSGVLKPME